MLNHQEIIEKLTIEQKLSLLHSGHFLCWFLLNLLNFHNFQYNMRNNSYILKIFL